jgi:4'-phosphopantetheinyl transferase
VTGTESSAARPGWLTCSPADVPHSDGWLSVREEDALARIGTAARQAEWLLGRWTAKTAVAAWLARPLAAVEIEAADDGAPQALVAGEPGCVAISLSHRGGRALALVGPAGVALGCDIEVAEPRSEAFRRRWLTLDEQALVAGAGPAGATQIANAFWTAKEAAAKVRRQGLLETRHAGVVLDAASREPGWRPLSVHWPAEPEPIRGWWSEEPGWVMAVAAAPPIPPPARIHSPALQV